MKIGDKIKVNATYDLLEDERLAFYGKTGEIVGKDEDFDNRWIIKLDEPIYLKFINEASSKWDFIEADLELI